LLNSLHHYSLMPSMFIHSYLNIIKALLQAKYDD
jgi:hypothetical protein